MVTKEELQQQYLKLLKEEKELRYKYKAKKEIFEQLASKYNIPLKKNGNKRRSI